MKNNKDEVKSKDEAIDRLKAYKSKIKEESVALSSRIMARDKPKKTRK